jgi:quercetin dioxygenase-like cupin family protein
MLSQIELGKSAPTVNVLWRITRALGLPFAALLDDPPGPHPVVLREESARRTPSAGGGVEPQAVFSAGSAADVEVREIRLVPGAVEHPQSSGGATRAFVVVVVEGALTLTIGADPPRALATGDSALFAPSPIVRCANDGPAPARMIVVRVSMGGERSGLRSG